MRLKKTYIIIWAVLPVCLFIISSVALSFSIKAGQVISTDEAEPKNRKIIS